MTTCTVCRTPVYNGFAAHVQMHEQARRNQEERKRVRILRNHGVVVSNRAELVIPAPAPRIAKLTLWQKICNFFGFGS